jgi:hypothetical protein
VAFIRSAAEVMRFVLSVLCAVAVAACATVSPAPVARGKTKAEALAAYGKPQKIIATSTGETWEYADVLAKGPTGALVKTKLLVISFDRSGKVMCWPCEFTAAR